MQYRRLGKSGPTVSCVGLGCNNFGTRLDQQGTRAVVGKALDLGITLFDTADMYSGGKSEEFLGKALGVRRKEAVLASKFGWPMDKEKTLKGASRRYIQSAVEASLKRLNTDRIDLYQLHLPDPETPIEETLRALEDLVKQGKIGQVGCSNFSAAQLDEAGQAAKAPGTAAFVSCQNEYSLLQRELEKDVLPALERHGMGLIPFAPLANGLLSGKYKTRDAMPEGGRLTNTPTSRFLTDRNWQVVDKLQGFCEQRGHTLLELAFSWLLAHPAVASVIAGAMTPEQLQQNVAATGWSLGGEDLKRVDELTA